MKRHTVLFAIALAGLVAAAAGCADNEPTTPGGAVATTTPAAPPAVTPTPPPQEAEKLTGRGVGPYVVGAALDALTSSGALANAQTSPGCSDWTTADATGPYSGKVVIVFFQKKISWVVVTSPSLSTVDGASVGMGFAAVKGIYGMKGDGLDDGHGGQALGVRETAGSGLLFRETKDGSVGTIEAGTYDTLEFRFVEGEGC